MKIHFTHLHFLDCAYYLLILLSFSCSSTVHFHELNCSKYWVLMTVLPLSFIHMNVRLIYVFDSKCYHLDIHHQTINPFASD
jgi:hypothetical protein